MVKGKGVTGIIAAIVTQFSDDEEVNCFATRILAGYLLDGGVDDIMTSYATCSPILEEK